MGVSPLMALPLRTNDIYRGVWVLAAFTTKVPLKLIQAFISSRLDYCNSVLYGVTDTTGVRTKRCRQVNHADGSPWTRLACSAGIALAACPTPCRLQTGNTDVQVATRLRTVVSLRRMQVGPWGQSLSLLVWRHHVRHTWSRTRLGDRSFDVVRPRLWNKLPASLQSSDSLCQFRRQLKTFLFVKD